MLNIMDMSPDPASFTARQRLGLASDLYALPRRALMRISINNGYRKSRLTRLSRLGRPDAG
ncbi:protein of unknown function (plasmid) [Cupriavidus neocaledonicus]|uniref:Uncharacterized protein n=1 Tax=Cupriavidus neocaledonicus TaxID=1040979 RepID=A0A375HR44_9BURK|nr:protein of unknown function [Cupriavidus neocaledonicus]